MHAAGQRALLTLVRGSMHAARIPACMQVFPTEAWAPLWQELKRLQGEGKPTIVHRKLRVSQWLGDWAHLATHQSRATGSKPALHRLACAR
jgi:hypothetical protein